MHQASLDGDADFASGAQVDGELWDLERPFEQSSSLELIDFESPEGELRRINDLGQMADSPIAKRQARVVALVSPHSG